MLLRKNVLVIEEKRVLFYLFYGGYIFEGYIFFELKFYFFTYYSLIRPEKKQSKSYLHMMKKCRKKETQVIYR